jgi:hypothetical protein
MDTARKNDSSIGELSFALSLKCRIQPCAAIAENIP